MHRKYLLTLTLLITPFAHGEELVPPSDSKEVVRDATLSQDSSNPDQPPSLPSPEVEQKITEHYTSAIDEPEAAVFSVPEGWAAVDPSQFDGLTSVQALVIGPGSNHMKPSINLGLEAYEGSLKSFLKKIKTLNETQGAVWKDLGQIATKSGNASLSQVDMPNEWGDVRQMHVIILRYGRAYILTAAALKDEFSANYKTFFNAFRSLKINKDVYEMVPNPEKRARLQTLVANLKANWNVLKKQTSQENPSLSEEAINEQLLADPKVKQELLTPFKEKIATDYKELGPKWYDEMIKKTQRELNL